jgi:hypothetical protein
LHFGPHWCITLFAIENSVRKGALVSTTQTSARLRIAPRAADLTIVADPTLTVLFDVDWTGAEPTVRADDDRIDVRYTPRARLRTLSPRQASLTLRLNPAAAWTIELAGGVSGLRADLRDLRITAFAIEGGASDIDLALPAPDGELALRIDGGVSNATVRRPAGVPVDVAIDGGATKLQVDERVLGAVGGEIRLPGADGDDRVAVRIRGGASRLAIAA